MPRPLIILVLVLVAVAVALVALSRIDASKTPTQVVKAVPDNALAH